MKKIALLAAFAISIHAFAQPVLSYSLTHSIGTQSVMYLIGGPTTSLQQTGMALTWDLSSNTVSQMGNLDIVDAATTPYTSSYPASNVCFKQSITSQPVNYMYLIDSPAELNSIAEDDGSTTTIWTQYDKLVQYPFNYSDVFTSTRQLSTGSPETFTRTYDSYGTLTINSKTYTNVIRVSKNPGNVIWFTTSPVMFPIIIQANSTTYLYNEPTTFTGINNLTINDPVTVYPNPAKEKLVIQLPGAPSQDNLEADLVNVFGQVVKRVSVSLETTTMELDNISPGVYFYQVRSGNSVMQTGKIIIQ